MQSIACKVCEKGSLVRKRVYRMSAPVVFIGYVFLIPSVLGICIGVLMLFELGSAGASELEETKTEIRAKLEGEAIPAAIIEQIFQFEEIGESSLVALNPEQIESIRKTEEDYQARNFAAVSSSVLAGGAAVIFMVCAFVGGLLGWLLVMKKRVLRCNACGATVSAS